MKDFVFIAGIIIIALLLLLLMLYFELARYKRYKKHVQKELVKMTNISAKQILLDLFEIIEEKFADGVMLSEQMREITREVMGAIDNDFDNLAHNARELSQRMFNVLEGVMDKASIDKAKEMIPFLEWNCNLSRLTSSNCAITAVTTGLYHQKYFSARKWLRETLKREERND